MILRRGADARNGASLATAASAQRIYLLHRAVPHEGHRLRLHQADIPTLTLASHSINLQQ